MDNFKTFQEDLASGRPAKKPVSSNLLKQRAKDNEKALKSGFMKMPDYVKKKFNEEKKNCGCGQDPCITYGKKEKVNEVSDHLKTRYIHKAMRDVDNKERASQLADKQGAPASVGKSLSKSTGKRRKGIARARANLERPIKEAKKPVVHYKGEDKLKMVKIKTNKPIKTKVTDIGPGGKEHVVKDWSESVKHKILAELSPKTISSYQKKAGKQYRDLKKSTPSRQGIENAYHQGYTSSKEYFKQHDDRDKLEKRGKGLAASKGKGVQKESSTWLQRTADTWNDHADHKHPKVKKHIKAAEKAYNNQDYDAFHHHTNRAADHAHTLRQTKKEDKNWPRPFTKDERQEFLDKAHKEAGYKKKSGTGLRKVKGGYERKTTYTKESSGDNYNPVISDKRTKEKLKKAGLPPESPKVNEGYYKRLATDAAEKLRMSKAKKEKEQNKKQINQPTMKEMQGHVYAGLLELTPTFMEGKKKGLDGKACWKGYRLQGTKKKGGKTVDNCVKTEDYTYESLNKLIGTAVDKVRGAIKDAEKRTGYKVDPAKRNTPNPVSGENIAKRLYGKSQKKR